MPCRLNYHAHFSVRTNTRDNIHSSADSQWRVYTHTNTHIQACFLPLLTGIRNFLQTEDLQVCCQLVTNYSGSLSEPHSATQLFHILTGPSIAKITLLLQGTTCVPCLLTITYLLYLNGLVEPIAREAL